MLYWHPIHAAFAALLSVLLGAVWIAFAPIQFGGQAAYVIVNGISMEPRMHRGDLAILRQAPDYEVGDIVTYRHPQIGPVIHRIIARDGDQLIFKGDNNSWIDGYRPTQAECIGKLWIYVPSIGSTLDQLRTPRNMALLAAALGVVVMATVTSSPNQRQWRSQGRGPFLTVRLVFDRRAAPAQARRIRRAGEYTHAAGAAGASIEAVFFLLAALAFASLLLGAFAFTRPPVRSAADDIGYEQSGEFSYSAAAPPGVYDSGDVRTGDPVFRQLTSAISVDFSYRLATDRPADLHGTYRLVAEISDVSGWKRALELQPEASFNGGTLTSRGVVELTRVQALIDSFEKQTALARPQYTLAVMPKVVVEGTLAGEALRDEFAPRLEFQLDKLQMQLVKDGGRTNDLLKPSQKGLLKHTRTEPNTIALLGLTLEVTMARRLAAAGLALALGGLLVLGLLMSRAARADEAARIRLKYGPLLVAIRDSDLEASRHLVDVAAIEDLAKLAEQTGRMILHKASGSAHAYFVHDGDVVYHYQVASQDEALAAATEEGAC